MESHLGLIIESHLGLLMDLSWVFLMANLIVPMMANLWVHCLVFQLDKILELSWVLLIVLLMVIQMACLRDKHRQYHLDILMVKNLAWMKASYYDMLLMKCLALHLDLLIELSWVLLMYTLMVTMMANLWVY